MRRSRSIVGAAVVVSGAVLIGAGFVASHSVGKLSSASDAVLRAKDLELDYERLLSTVRDAETGQRGYLLTNDPRYLAPYEDALHELDRRMDLLQKQLHADDGPAEDLLQVKGLVVRKMAELEATVALNRAGDRAAAIALVRSNEGKELMDDIRSAVGRKTLEQQARVAHLQQIEASELRAAIRTGVIVCALAVVLMLLLMYIVRRDWVRVRASENRLATTLRSIGDAVIATDAQGAVTITNPMAEKLTGWPHARAVGKPLEQVFNIVNEETRAVVESPVSKVLRQGGIVGLANHTVLLRHGGGETAIEDSGAPILDDAGQTTGVVLVFRDATEERAAQRALRDADKRKDEFLATLAHELRNPLAPIRQAASAAAHPAATPENLRWSLGVIQRQVAHMARLLDDLLDVSRITRGRLEVRRERIALGRIVDSAVEIARPAIDSGKHQLSIELPDEALDVSVDPLRMAQVLGNLLTNAARYTPNGGSIRITAERIDDEVRIRVIDNGIGLATVDLPRIFEMFTQVAPTPNRPNTGLGIGLALSKALVELHGGSIEARSAGPGKGSELVVRLGLA